MKDRIRQILSYKRPKKSIQTAMLAGCVICALGLLSGGVVYGASGEAVVPGADAVEDKDAEASSIAIIGGADGPTSIFIAGKLGGGADEEPEEAVLEADIPELIADTFLNSYYTVLYEDAAKLLEDYEAEAQAMVEKMRETELEESSGGVYEWESEVLNNLVNEDMYLFLTEEGKEKMLSNRYLLRAFQLAQEQKSDLSVDEYEMTVDYEEEEQVRYEYLIKVRAGEKEIREAKGFICMVTDEAMGWKIDEFTTEFVTEQE